MHRALRAGAVAVALSVMGVGGPARAEETTAIPVDLVGNLDADAIARLDRQLGPVVFHEVLLQDHPTAREVREADPDDSARPKPILVIDSLGSAVLDLTIRLEGDDGLVLVSCAGVKVVGKEWKDLIELCRSGPVVKTADWPRVKAVRVLGTVKARE